MTWRNNAACKGKTHLFFSNQPSQLAKGHKLCETCPVTGACAQEAFTLTKQGQLHGTWGGTTQNYREQLVGRNTGRWWEHAG